MSLITSFLLLVIYLGYAGVWGALLRQPWRDTKWLGIIIGIFLFLPASLGLPWAIIYRLPVWGMAILTIVIFMKRPAIMPVWLWRRDFLFGYFGATMFFVLVWTIITGEPEFWFWLGLPALLAGLTGLYRIKCRGNQPGAV
jgi:hypothetical protein